MDQIRSLRSRALIERMADSEGDSRGALLRIGNTAEEILKRRRDTGAGANIHVQHIESSSTPVLIGSKH